MSYLFIGAAVGYILCSWAAFLLMWRDCKNAHRSLTRADRRFIILMSCMGPISVGVALIVYLAGKDWGGDEIIWRRDDRK